ncbi:MAG: serine hydrolase [Bacteroidota bacterium]|nr:serine hydrolase [Bacteroidota bacterium]
MRSNLKIILTLIFFLVLKSNLYSQDKAQKIDELIKKYNEYNQFNGSVLVAENGKIILEKGYGYADIEWKIPNSPETKFRLASVTKQFTAMLTMQLVEQGKIKLDGKITDYLSYYPNNDGKKVTIHNLLSHTSGIPNMTEDPDVMRKNIRNHFEVKELVVNFCSKDVEFEPGTKWRYNNSGYVILGAIIEEVTGKKYEDVLNENILIPLDMTNSGYDHTSEIIENRASGYDQSPAGYTNTRFLDMSIPYSAGSMYSTVKDLFKWDRALYSDRLVSEDTKQKIFTNYIHDYGYGWEIRNVALGNINKNIISHSGDIFGFSTMITRYPNDNNCIILLSNSSSANIEDLNEGISEILYDQPYKMPRRSLSEILYRSLSEKKTSDAVAEFNELRKNKTEYYADENEINLMGYNLLNDGKIDDAIEVFKLNVENFPDSFNVYDSLGEAYMKKGDKELAIKNYKKSIELNPQNEGGVKNLKF